MGIKGGSFEEVCQTLRALKKAFVIKIRYLINGVF